MPIKLMKTEPVANPAIVHSTPIKASNGDKAETYSFKNHNAAAGQRSRKKSEMLVSAAIQPETTASIWIVAFIRQSLNKAEGIFG